MQLAMHDLQESMGRPGHGLPQQARREQIRSGLALVYPLITVHDKDAVATKITEHLARVVALGETVEVGFLDILHLLGRHEFNGCWSTQDLPLGRHAVTSLGVLSEEIVQPMRVP